MQCNRWVPVNNYIQTEDEAGTNSYKPTHHSWHIQEYFFEPQKFSFENTTKICSNFFFAHSSTYKQLNCAYKH